VWLVTGYRAGERNQVIALGEALGWPFELKELSYRPTEFRTSLFRGSDLRGIRLDKSSSLEPPWPDLVISAGMRNEPVCRWIRAQQGGRTRIVHIGRPWAHPDNFDLIVTTPQYRLAEHPKVLQNTLTLHRVTPERLEQEAARWQAQFEHLNSPRTMVILGGNSGPYTLGSKNAHAIAQQVEAQARQRGGSLMISTSARTSPAVIDIFEREITVPHVLYRWRPDDTENPYFGMLALCDELVVTADSISMLSEACATGKPVWMAPLGGYGYPMREDQDIPVDFRLSAWNYSLMMRWGHPRLSRDIRLVHRRLLEQGRVAWLGEPAAGSTAPSEDMARAVTRVRALF
jgi:mitochondrial fission protein ELM1